MTQRVRLIPGLGVFDEDGRNRFSDYVTVEGDTGILTDEEPPPALSNWRYVKLDNGRGVVPVGPGHYEELEDVG